MPSATYAELLTEAQPQIIDDQRSHHRALRVIERLMDKQRRTKAEQKMLDLLVKLAEDYEETIYPTPTVPPGELLQFLLNSRGLSQADIARQLDIARSTISEVVQGKRSLSVENAFRLGEFFKLEPSAFLSRD